MPEKQTIEEQYCNTTQIVWLGGYESGVATVSPLTNLVVASLPQASSAGVALSPWPVLVYRAHPPLSYRLLSVFL